MSLFAQYGRTLHNPLAIPSRGLQRLPPLPSSARRVIGRGWGGARKEEKVNVSKKKTIKYFLKKSVSKNKLLSKTKKLRKHIT